MTKTAAWGNGRGLYRLAEGPEGTAEGALTFDGSLLDDGDWGLR